MMPSCRRPPLPVWSVFAVLGLSAWAAAQPGGFVPERRYELSGTVEVDRADSSAIKALNQAKAYLADKQFNDGIDLLLKTMETSGAKLVAVSPNRYLPLRDACQWVLISLPPEGLAQYRRRVDAEARRLYEEGVTHRDVRRLRKVVERYLASRWADDALDALGEIALESGDPAAARSFWERIVPVAQGAGQSLAWLGVPDTELDLAAVRARLVLASILEGSTERAGEELARFIQLHAQARGWFGGREVRYADALSALLAESAQWPRPQPRGDWPTFAGAASRNAIAAWPTDALKPAWRVPLPRSDRDRGTRDQQAEWSPRVAEDGLNPLSTFPAVSGGHVYLNRGNREILALNLADGRPAWGDTATVFEDELGGDLAADARRAGALGVARFTVTVFGTRLYARMGTPLTSQPRQASQTNEAGYLICLDLAGQGRLAWKIAAEPGWAFEGSPVADAANAYVAMRRSEVQTQAHVACYAADTGQLRWRQFLCAADTPARGALPEITHNLLTLHGDTLFVNTNLGAVAAVDVGNGAIRWLTTYPRSLKGDLAKPPAHACRDLTPCLYDRGVLYVAPADARSIFALDAASGQILWQSGSELEEVVHLLGVSHDCLIASGGRLYWINLKEPEQGRLKHVWPDGAATMGYGRGLLAGDCVLWPAREKIYQFDQAAAKLQGVIDLALRGLRGGNLVAAGGRLLIATPDELVALGGLKSAPSVPEEPLTLARRLIDGEPGHARCPWPGGTTELDKIRVADDSVFFTGPTDRGWATFPNGETRSDVSISLR